MNETSLYLCQAVTKKCHFTKVKIVQNCLMRPEPPNILLSGEELVSAQDDLDELEAKRVAESETLKDTLYITVSRHEVLTELLRLYVDDQVFSKKIVPTFEGENSSGDGVLCELYSLFWEDFLRENYNRARTVAVAPNSP